MEGYKEYLGDGVYVSFDGYGVVLTTENGLGATNRIVLEPEVMLALADWSDRLKQELKEKWTKRS